MKRYLVAIAVIAAFTVLPLATAGASTQSSFHARNGAILGMIPRTELHTQLTNQAPASGSLYYNGGPVMTENKAYTIFWQPSGYSFPSGYQNNLNQFFKDLQASQGSNTNTYDNATQYYQVNSNGSKSYVKNKVTYEGTVLDTNPLPPLDPVNCPDTPGAAAGGGGGGQSTTAGCVTDSQVQQEISNEIKANHWSVDSNTEFFLYTAPNIGTCFPATVAEGGTQVGAPLCSFTYFCAYHSSYFDSTISGSQIIYSNMPYDAQTSGSPVTCDVGDYPNGNPSDPEVSTTSHEQNESMTDPFGTGWWDSNSNDSASGDENGDMCAYDFGTTTGATNAEWDQTINSHHYLMQLEWDNTTNGCPGSDSSGNPTTHPNYDIPAITLTPTTGFATAPFKIFGQFFAAGDQVKSHFKDGALNATLNTTALKVNPSGHFTQSTKVPAKAKAGTATVTSKGTSGTASSNLTVPS